MKLNKLPWSILGYNYGTSRTLYTVGKYSNKDKRNANVPSAYKKKYVYEPPVNGRITYQPMEDRALKAEQKAEYLKQAEADDFNLYVKKERELIKDSYFSSNFTEFMRSRKLFNSPMHRVSTICKDDFTNLTDTLDLYPTFKLDKNGRLIKECDTPFEMITDVVVIGGGMVGVSIAYHIKRMFENQIKLTIIDKDFSYGNGATKFSLGGLRQQFGMKENIELSKYAASFLDNAKEELGFEGHVPDIGFNYSGCLTLADKKKMKDLKENYSLLRENDVDARLLYRKELLSLFPWMNADGIEGGILGMEQEGWFDHLSLLDSLHRNCSHLGTDYIVGDFVDSDLDELQSDVMAHLHTGKGTRVTSIKVKLPSGPKISIPCGIVVLAAGINTPQLAKILEIGAVNDEDSVFGKMLPILKRRHFVYKIHAPKGPGLNCPVIIAPNGLIVRRDGLANMYICQVSPPVHLDDNEETIQTYFKKCVLLALQKISKSFNNCKIVKSHSVCSDFNEFDQNPIIGFHRGVTNLFIASGFNNNSVHALGVGNYFMEKVLCQERTIDLSEFTPDRVLSPCDSWKLIDKSIY